MKLIYFAWVRERVGKTEEQIDPPAGVATVGELMAWLARRGEEYAHAFDNPKVIRAAIDRSHVRADATDRRRRRDRLLSADDRRLRFVTPMAPMTVTVRLQREPFDVATEVERMTRGRTEIGAVVTFTGLCRADEDGEPIAALTLEHYPGMAEAEIARHVEEARARWPLLGVSVLHRYGRLTPGDAIVLVATASSHRQAAFAAAEFLDGLPENPRAVLEAGREGFGKDLGRRQGGR